MNKPSTITCSIDLSGPGRRIGHLNLAHSNNRHAYGVIPVPIGVVANGDGPTVLITAGNHGDEHEGPLLVRRLLQELDPRTVTGRIIALPALNYPAVMADARVSPLDDGNMNRAFPGDPGGGPTAQIAYFVETVLLPESQASLDLHSGGKASEFLPCAFLVASGDSNFLTQKIAAVKAFGAPDTTVVGGTADGRSLSAAADRHGVVNIATELGGGGTLSQRTLEIGRDGLRRWLQHNGVVTGPEEDAAPGTRFLRTRDRRDFVMALTDGLFEPAAALGAHVRNGDIAGYLHAVEDPGRAPEPLHFSADGVVVCRRVPSRCMRGDYLFHIGEEMSEAQVLASA